MIDLFIWHKVFLTRFDKYSQTRFTKYKWSDSVGATIARQIKSQNMFLSTDVLSKNYSEFFFLLSVRGLLCVIEAKSPHCLFANQKKKILSFRSANDVSATENYVVETNIVYCLCLCVEYWRDQMSRTGFSCFQFA